MSHQSTNSPLARNRARTLRSGVVLGIVFLAAGCGSTSGDKGTDSSSSVLVTNSPSSTQSSSEPTVTDAPTTTAVTVTTASVPRTSAPSTSAAPGPSVPAGVSGPAVSIVDFSFEPAALSVRVGDTVTWVNNDAFDHSVVSPGSFASDTLAPSTSFTTTFSAPGTFTYLCGIHPYMTGEVNVTS